MIAILKCDEPTCKFSYSQLYTLIIYRTNVHLSSFVFTLFRIKAQLQPIGIYLKYALHYQFYKECSKVFRIGIFQYNQDNRIFFNSKHNKENYPIRKQKRKQRREANLCFMLLQITKEMISLISHADLNQVTVKNVKNGCESEVFVKFLLLLLFKNYMGSS